MIVAVEDAPKLRTLMESRGFALREGNPPHSFVLVDDAEAGVDVHAVTFDADGRGTHQMEEGGECLSPAAQVLCHTQGYEPTEKDLRDMTMLHDRFGVELPPSLRLTAIEP